MKNLITFFLPFLLIFSGNSDNSGNIPEIPDNSISCAPVNSTASVVEHRTVKDGDWYDPSVWSTGKVPAETDTKIQTHKLYSNNRNIVNRGLWIMEGNAGIQFRNIDESRFVGGGMEVLDTDVGIWIMGSGRVEWRGKRLTPWSYLTGSLLKGATSATVTDATGWEPGNEIVIAPTDKPDNNVSISSDPFGEKFERRTITRIAGNTIYFSEPLRYDHQEVAATERKWTAEVANISRSIVIEGQEKKRAHIYIRSTSPQLISFVEGRYLGPRKSKANQPDSLVGGRYGMHFHHSMAGSRGSIVEGNAYHDIGNRVYVPHVSEGIYYRHNISYKSLETPFWWDENDHSNDIVYDHNLVMHVQYNGRDNHATGFLLGRGDGNVCKNNTVVYGHKRDLGTRGDYAWEAGNDGMWLFENNLSHSSVVAAIVWQNSHDPHVIANFTVYNAMIGWKHGAYFNAYTFHGGYFYNTFFQEKAGSINTAGVRMKEVVFDNTVLEFISSPARSSTSAPIRIINPRFINGSYPIINVEALAGENPFRIIDLINYDGPAPRFSSTALPDSYYRVLYKNGTSKKMMRSGTSDLAPFDPGYYGTGTGLKGEYFNSPDLKGAPAAERLEPALHYDTWGESEKIALFNKDAVNKVFFALHNKVTAQQFSARYSGQIEAQYSEPYTFQIGGSVASRIWVDDKLILDSWTDKEDWYSAVQSTPIHLEKGKKYAIKLEISNSDRKAQLYFLWKSPSMPEWLLVPEYQLYAQPGVEPPPPNRPPVADAGPDREITLPDSTLKIEGIATDPDNNVKSAVWSGDVEIKQNLSEISHAMVKVKAAGVYPLTLTVTDQQGLTHSDQMILTVKPAPVVTYYNKAVSGTYTKTCPTGSTGSKVTYTVKDSTFSSTISQSTADALAQKRVLDSGQVYANRVGTCTPSGVNQKPKVSVGEDISINQGVTVTATASDADGTIISYSWTKVSGPLAPEIENKTSRVTRITGLKTGTYVFRCTVKDNKNATSYDDVTIKVN